jgi:hypothetical protein
MWSAVLERSGWSNLEQFPTPPGTRVNSFSSSPRLASGDSLFWATTPLGTVGEGFMAWQRNEGVWSFTKADAGIVARVEANWLADRGPAVLAITARPQPWGEDLMRGRTDLKLWSPKPSWAVFETILGQHDHYEMWAQRTESSLGPVYSMITHVGGMPPIRVEARAVVGNTAPGGPQWHTLSENADQLIAVGSPNIPPVWLMTDRGPATDQTIIRVLQLSAGGAISRSELPNPFKGRFEEYWDGESILTLVGGVLEPEAVRAPLYGLIYRLRLNCNNPR